MFPRLCFSRNQEEATNRSSTLAILARNDCRKKTESQLQEMGGASQVGTMPDRAKRSPEGKSHSRKNMQYELQTNLECAERAHFIPHAAADKHGVCR